MAEIVKIESKDGNIYEVDGKRYRELTKEPAIGDTVLVVDAWEDGEGYEEGEVHTLTKILSRNHEDVNAVRFVDKEGRNNYLKLSEFVIVEPIESETPSHLPYLSDILDDIKTKLTRLEERTEENHRNILTFSQTAESARSDASKAIGGVNALDEQLDLVREDIVFLDEKIDELKETTQTQGTPQNITININVLDIGSAKAIVESFTKGRE
ncbi:hypothetical protein [Bacillus cytotoxicus]|uniref:hypothetical protein n=1 Tax=Bacillus cytotoxicus TaxID=580165 RepID=UPI000863F2A8|nr:hypothetical protein [Bacillus cytotoxicus]AWC29094.1 hypothetical protein CG483_012645 [Bacillus cytotoxicus]AWC39520.1 hypothetical protein CG480_002605 [Bacillus cytotoxicus]AWC47451.1 hypothetical protein CG478_002605 [Bacillus cytotoxicus]AWC53165.1 hypothetical protein CG477_012605 [Bacillus cytotoxicus]AWC57294.1 hypothetical protein CG476_012630 [Bacillus cytotoxicus]